MISVQEDSFLDRIGPAHTRLQHFRRRLFEDADLQQQLQTISEWSSFADQVVRRSREYGCPVTEQDIQTLRQVGGVVDRSGLLTPQTELTTDAAHLKGWSPLKVVWRDGRPLVNWYFIGDRRFTDPFFSHTALKCQREPFNALFWQQTSMATLGTVAKLHPGIKPTGFIYHMSRCGSTLVSQMLAALPQNIVLSEPDPINTLLEIQEQNTDVTAQEITTWLPWLLSALAQPRLGTERNLFLKLDCWHILSFSLLRQAFPDVPWIFLYRDPVEVLVSHRRQPGSQTVPGVLDSALFGLDLQTALILPPDEYAARVMAACCQAAIHSLGEGGGRLVSYRELPEAVTTWLPDYFGVDFTDTERETMRGVIPFDAKTPSLNFENDEQIKQQEATESIRQIAQQWLIPLYQQMESLREAQPPVC